VGVHPARGPARAETRHQPRDHKIKSPVWRDSFKQAAALCRRHPSVNRMAVGSRRPGIGSARKGDEQRHSRFCLSLLLYALCLPLHSFCTYDPTCFRPGWEVLALGWLGLLMLKTPHLAWLANPVLFIAWLYLLHALSTSASGAATHRSSLIVVLLATAFLLWPEVADNEGGVLNRVQLGIGYWLWLASTACAFISAALLKAARARS
jgi:hypothetical protein